MNLILWIFLLSQASAGFTPETVDYDSLSSPTCWDLDRNGRVDFADFILFAQNYKDPWWESDFQDFQTFFGKETDCVTVGSYIIRHPKPSSYGAVYPTPTVKVVRITPGSIRLSWKMNNSDSAEIVTGYWIYRSPHPIPKAMRSRINPYEDGKGIQIASRDSTAFIVKPLLAETDYTLKVSAMYGGRGLTQLSPDVEIEIRTPAFSEPGPPVLVFLGWDDKETAQITWSKRPSIIAYRIFKDGEVEIPWIGPNLRNVLVGGLTNPYVRYQIVGESLDTKGKTYVGDPLVLCLWCDD